MDIISNIENFTLNLQYAHVNKTDLRIICNRELKNTPISYKFAYIQCIYAVQSWTMSQIIHFYDVKILASKSGGVKSWTNIMSGTLRLKNLKMGEKFKRNAT